MFDDKELLERPQNKRLIKDLNKLNEDQKEEIIEVFKTYLPEDMKGLLKKLKKNFGAEIGEVSGFVIGFFYLCLDYYKSNESINNFLEFRNFGNHQEFIKRLLDMDDSIGIISKLIFLESKNKSTLLDTNIITDLRPIYYNDPLIEPKYGIIKHTLYLEVVNDQREEIYITLTDENLKKLSRAIERALNKEETLSNTCKKNNIKLFKGFKISNE